MKIKKLIYRLLIPGLLFSLSSCGTTESTNDSNNNIDTLTKPLTTGNIPSEQQTYIKDIKAVGAYWDKYAFNGSGVLKDKYGLEYSRLSDWNLNCDCGTTKDCIYLYENRTIHAEEAIRDIIAVTQKDIPETFKYNNHNYQVVGGVRVNGLNSSKTTYARYDLNMNAGGDYIYLCVSYDKDIGKPITNFKVGGLSSFDSNTKYNFIYNFTNKGEYQNFNAGTGGTAIYASISSVITGWIINDITLYDQDIHGNEYTKIITLDTNNKYLTEEQLKPIIDKGEGAYFQGYYDKKTNDGAKKVTTSMPFLVDDSIWARWTYDITIDFTNVGGEVMTFTNVSSFPYFNEYGLYYYVLEETGEKNSGGLHWPGKYIAVEYTD